MPKRESVIMNPAGRLRMACRVSSPEGFLLVLLAGWWVLNVLQAAFTGLADDEGYYWLFARTPDWGYYDHPPMTALLVALGDFLGGSLGIRFFFTLLQPVSLYLLWTLVRPSSPTKEDALLFFLICFALPVAQLYGFIAVPDSPLMLTAIFFIWCYDRFCREDSWKNMFLLGLSMALMAYSKYHGALVVLLTIMSNPKVLLRPKLYLSGMVTLLLFLPHLLWQYSHDWVSFRYHLAGRNGYFDVNDLLEFWMNIVLIFNPLFVWFYAKGWGKGEYAGKSVRRSFYFIAAGFIIFFTLSSLRGYVQPQWVIPITYPFIMILFGWCLGHPKARTYVMKASLVTAALVLLVRVVAIFNPFGLKFEIFGQEDKYAAIGELAGGRPVIFNGNYSIAAKYIYYTGGEAFCQPKMDYRTSQWQYIPTDRSFAGREVIAEVPKEYADSTTAVLVLPDGNEFFYETVPGFHSVREVRVDVLNQMPEMVHPGDNLGFDLRISNPYPYDVVVSPVTYPLELVWGRNKERFSEYVVSRDSLTVPSCGTVPLHVSFTVPESFRFEPVHRSLNGHLDYRMGFALKNRGSMGWFASDEFTVRLVR